MKEATGNLSSGVVVVFCVAILVAFFYFTVWPIINNNFKAQTACDKAACEQVDSNNDGYVNCSYDNTIIECKFKG